MPKKAMFCSLNSYNVAEGRDRVDGWLSVLQLDDLDWASHRARLCYPKLSYCCLRRLGKLLT